MSHERTVYYTCYDTRSWKRVAIGLPIRPMPRNGPEQTPSLTPTIYPRWR